MRRLRTLGRWVTDWRNGATLAATLFAVVLILVVNDAIAGRREAFEQLSASRAAASRRIDLLQGQINELIGRGETNAALLGELVAQVDALRSQVRELGGEPVVEAPTRPSPSPTTTQRLRATPAPSPTTTTAPGPTAPGPTTTTTAPIPPPEEPNPEPRPAPPPLPIPCRIVAVPLVCTGG